MMPSNAWREACVRRIGYAAGWDMTIRENRAELRRWRRRLWFAKWGMYLSALYGTLIGSLVGIGLAYWMTR